MPAREADPGSGPEGVRVPFSRRWWTARSRSFETCSLGSGSRSYPTLWEIVPTGGELTPFEPVGRWSHVLERGDVRIRVRNVLARSRRTVKDAGSGPAATGLSWRRPD